MNSLKEKTAYSTILVISIACIAGIFALEPIAQDPAYHLFSDQRTIFGIPNFWNVVTNLPFLVIGMMGLIGSSSTGQIKLLTEIKPVYILFFSAVILVNFGSAYYHLWPDNETLVWDRLPMTVAFMALFTVIIGEFASIKASKMALWPLLIFGIFSVIYWHFTESAGQGDLRLYALVQFLPMLLIPLLIVLFEPRFTLVSGYWFMLMAYALAKVFEHFDEAVFNSFGVISGHSLKHIMAALGVLFLLRSYTKRKRVEMIPHPSP
jgi:hypothetical protein